MEAQTILVTGGTGFVGAEVVRHLVQQGHKVRVISRRETKLKGTETVRADVHKPETLGDCFQGVSTLIHCVGIIVESHSTFEQAHVQVTENMLQAAQAAGVRRVILMGSIGTRPNARSRYHKTKWQAEELVRGSGMDWTIFRASLIYHYDENDRIFKMISRLIMPPLTWLFFRSFAVFGAGKNTIQPVSVKEVAHCLSQAVTTPESIGQLIDLVGPEPVTFRTLVTKIAKVEGLSVRYEFLPILTTIRAIITLAALIIPVIGFLWLYQPSQITMSAENSAWQYLWHPTREIELTLAGVWLVCTVIALTWRELIIFSIPTFIPRLLSTVVGFGEQFKMAEEDNVGDPSVASKIFHYQPESLDQALKDYFR